MKKNINLIKENAKVSNITYAEKDKFKIIVEKLKAEVNSLKSLVIREKAENENLRKRFEKELNDSYKFSIRNFVRSLIEQVEDLFRASESVDKKFYKVSSELKTLHEGIEIIKKKILKNFRDFKIERIYPIHKKFDHTFHEAISQVVDNKKQEDTIIGVIQAGYSIHGSLVRPAIVVVSKKA